jgi:hypothetical protein
MGGSGGIALFYSYPRHYFGGGGAEGGASVVFCAPVAVSKGNEPRVLRNRTLGGPLV